MIAKVPLAEDPCPVAAGTKHISEGDHVAAEESTSCCYRCGLISKRVHTTHQLASSRRAHRRDVKVSETYGFGVETVYVGSLQNGITVARHVAVALIVR